ncbi:MAG: DUF177 domain-containing protein [Firmicutes bacterium]|nr:DUF177 domain-containing protein [Bacillota bacterium]
MLLYLDELSTKDSIEFIFNVVKDSDLDVRINELKNALVKGRIYLNSLSEIMLECYFSGTMLIEDSITLNSVPYNFNIEIEENLDEIKENYIDCYEKGKNTLDLKTILWQNIVLEVPISYTEVLDAELKGNGWELVNENKKVDEIDPRLKKLEDLLKGDD